MSTRETSPVKARGNCEACAHIDYIEVSYEEGESGYVCNGREYYDSRQNQLESNMQRKSYRNRSKVCFEPRMPTEGTTIE